MKCHIVAVALILISGAAHADTSTYVWQGKGPWSDADLQAAARVCDGRFGVVQNGDVTSSAYKRCMLNQKWKYQSTARVRSYIDNDTGMSCHDENGWAVCEPPNGTVHYQNRHGLNCTRTGAMSVCSNL